MSLLLLLPFPVVFVCACCAHRERKGGERKKEREQRKGAREREERQQLIFFIFVFICFPFLFTSLPPHLFSRQLFFPFYNEETQAHHRHGPRDRCVGLEKRGFFEVARTRLARKQGGKKKDRRSMGDGKAHRHALGSFFLFFLLLLLLLPFPPRYESQKRRIAAAT